MVRFTDYGNFDYVNEEEMVLSTSDIPHSELIDENARVGEIDSFRAACSDIGSSDDSSLSSLESDQEGSVNEDPIAKPDPVAVSDPRCSVCELSAKKLHRLVCDGSLVCWNCAVKVM